MTEHSPTWIFAGTCPLKGNARGVRFHPVDADDAVDWTRDIVFSKSPTFAGAVPGCLYRPAKSYENGTLVGGVDFVKRHPDDDTRTRAEAEDKIGEAFFQERRDLAATRAEIFACLDPLRDLYARTINPVGRAGLIAAVIEYMTRPNRRAKGPRL